MIDTGRTMTRTTRKVPSGNAPRILTWRSALAVAATIGNLVLWRAFGLGAVFRTISDRASENLAILWFTASALCALTTLIVMVMIILKLLIIGIDTLTGETGAAKDA